MNNQLPLLFRGGSFRRQEGAIFLETKKHTGAKTTPRMHDCIFPFVHLFSSFEVICNVSHVHRSRRGVRTGVRRWFFPGADGEGGYRSRKILFPEGPARPVKIFPYCRVAFFGISNSSRESLHAGG